MKNIEIVIDASGSADMVAIEKYLMHLQFDPSLENDNIQVSFYSAGERLRDSLKNIESLFHNENSINKRANQPNNQCFMFYLSCKY